MTVSPTVLHVAREPRTGVWSVMRQLGAWQRDRGYRVGFGLLVSRGWPESYREQLAEVEKSGICVMTGWSPNIFGTGAILYHRFSNPVGKWARTFGGGRPMVVHFHNAWLSGAYLPIRAGLVTAAVTYHGIQGERALRVQPLRRRIHAGWAQRLVHHGVRHATVDRHNIDVAQDLFGVTPSVFTVIANGTTPPPPGITGCPRLQSPSLPLTVGHVGIVDEGKGWRITAEAVHALRQQGHDVRYVIAGSGPQADDARAWCTAHNAFATYLGHSRNPQADVFPGLDVMALPSMGEGLPMAVLEALSFGIPVVATAVGGLPDVIRDGENGMLIERSVAALAEALQRILGDARLHANLSHDARQSFEASYSVDVMGRTYEELYSAGQP